MKRVERAKRIGVVVASMVLVGVLVLNASSLALTQESQFPSNEHVAECRDVIRDFIFHQQSIEMDIAQLLDWEKQLRPMKDSKDKKADQAYIAGRWKEMEWRQKALEEYINGPVVDRFEQEQTIHEQTITK